MDRRQVLGRRIAVAAARLANAALAITYFAIMVVRPSRRLHFGQQFLYRTEGRSFERSLAAFCATADGQRLLGQRPDVVAILRDGARLQAQPPGSLGRSLYDFMMEQEIDGDLALAIEAGQHLERDPGRAWFRTRMEAGHDMRHVLTGYGIDLFGETCLLAFRFGQTRHTGTFVIAAFGLLVLACRRQSRLMPAMREAYRRGRKARLLDLLPWEEALERPLIDLQREFGLEAPRCYSSDVQAISPTKGHIDICRTFGPLGAMHAALDREGIGLPCGVVARFEDKDECEVESAIAIARQWFPVLQTRLDWQNGRPALVPGAFANRDGGVNPLLDFSASETGAIWKYRLVREGRNTWLQATWMHGSADGLSMLRFLKAIGAVLDDRHYVPEPRVTRQPLDQQQFLAWLPAFLFSQRRNNRDNYVGLGQPVAGISQVSWLSVPVADRDRVMELARTAGQGMAGWLAAAVALAFADRQGRPGGEIFLNVPIARDDLAQTNGFGFGLGALRFPIRLGDSPSMTVLASAIGERLQKLANRGWDRNLERFLGSNPARHARFARIEAGRSTDPNITISWKGYHAALGANGGPRDVACFAAAPTLHVSAHADANGFSLSLTSRQDVDERRALLLQIARQLGCQAELAVHELADLGAGESDIGRTGSIKARVAAA